MPERKVHIIGVAPQGASSLSAEARRLVRRAGIVFGGERLLAMFPSIAGEKVAIKNNLAAVSSRMKKELGRKRMVVLASGDPGFFGIARYLTEKLGREAIEVIPNVSAMQLAFARVGESWDDAALVSVHSRPIVDILETVRDSRKTGIFTDDRNTPDRIARELLESGIEDCAAHVCQDLGSDAERVVSARLSELARMEFSPLSVMILIKEASPAGGTPRRCLGIPEAEFSQLEGRSLITKLEVRAVSLAKLGLSERSTVWDIGAGSGAVSIEASFLAGSGRVFAVEKDDECLACIRENVRKFGRSNITVVPGVAPGALEGLPAPDAVFVGGSGGRMAELIDSVCRRLKPGGRVVCNTATLQNMQEAVTGLERNGFEVEVSLVNIARSRDIAGLTRLEPLNPVFVVSGSRLGERSDHVRIE